MPMTVNVRVLEGKGIEIDGKKYEEGVREVNFYTANILAGNNVLDLTEMQGRLLYVIDYLVTYDLGILNRPGLGDELNFRQIVPLVEDAQAMFNNMASLDGVRFLTNEIAESICISSMDFLRTIEVTKDFRTSDGKSAWQSRIDAIRSAYAKFIDIITPYVGVIQLRLMETSKAGDIIKQEIESIKAQMQKEFSDTTAQAQKEIVEVKKTLEAAAIEVAESKGQAEESLAEIENIKAAARDASGKLGIGEEAKYFEEEARRHRMAMWGWFGGTIVTAIILIIYIWGAYIDPSVLPINLPMVSGESKWGNAILFAGRTLIFGVLAYIVFLCGRNFLAHKHNFVVNQHRWQALQTYRAIVEANDTPQAREVVLHYAAKCIFSPQETGFSKSSGGAREMSLIESIRKITPSGGGG